MTVGKRVPDKAGLRIACALGGSLAFSINDITVKSFSATLPLHEVVLFRALVALLFTLAFFAPGKTVAEVFRTRRLPLHLCRGACVAVSNLTYFAAPAALPLAQTSAIFFIAPLLITALSALVLRERVGPLRWWALVVCLAMGLAFGRGQLAGSGDPLLDFMFRAWAWPGLRDLAFFLVTGTCSAIGGVLGLRHLG